MPQQKTKSRRRRRSPSEIKAILVAYHSSGLSQREFAQKRQVSLATLSHWLRRERQNRKPAQEKPAKSAGSAKQFIPVQLPKASVAAPVLELEFPDGMVLRVPADFAPDHLQKLLTILRSC
jgi:transposase-like protein